MAVKPVRKPSSASEDEIILWGVKPTPASQFKVGDRVYYHVIKKVTKGNVTADEVERKFGKVVSVGEEGIGIKVPSEPLQYVSKIPLFSLKDLAEVKTLPKPPTPYRITQFDKNLREAMEKPLATSLPEKKPETQ